MYYISSSTALALALALVATVQAAPAPQYTCSDLTSGALQSYKHGDSSQTQNVHTHTAGGNLLSQSKIDTWVTYTACNRKSIGKINKNQVYLGQVKSDGQCFTRQTVGNEGTDQNLVLKNCEDVNSGSDMLQKQWFHGQYINNLLRLVPTDGGSRTWRNENVDANYHNVLNFYQGGEDESAYGLGLNENP
ncbi:hypothetical protein MSPP1_004029 [Malassezia sp. CBS 17886]|nr:hypothetical protein MSPP1_004029 [Malassezia sp. CBS 17886]